MKINKIVLLDDDPIVNVINEQLLRKYSASKQYIVCRTSKEAIDYINSADPVPEIVIIDLNIPLVNGFEFLDLFYSKFFNNVSVYILTSSINPIDLNKSRQYPFVKGYLKKPLTREIVQEIIAAN